MNFDHLTTGSLEARLRDILIKFQEMKMEINYNLTLSCLQLGVAPLRLSYDVEFRDPNKVFSQYFEIADIEYCEANKSNISTIAFNLQDISSIPLDFKNNARVQFLTHFDKEIGFIIEIYLS